MQKIKIDTRETNQELYDSFDILATEKGFEYVKETLYTGDVVCGNVVIERKAANDFVSSICSGHLSEQMAKMCLNYKHKYVIIEGNPFKTRSKISTNALIGTMTSLCVKYDVKIINVDTPAQFAYACYSLIRKHQDGLSFNPAEYKQVKYKITDEDIMTSMIYQIPRIGWDKARLIAEKYEFKWAKVLTEMDSKGLQEIDGIGKTTAGKIMMLLRG